MRLLLTLLIALCSLPALADTQPLLPQRPLFAPIGQAPASSPVVSSVPLFNNTQDGIASFMYFSERQWSFWWRGQRITPTTVPATITDLEVSEQRIRFLHDGQEYSYTIGKFN